jgi:hypothetical protein
MKPLILQIILFFPIGFAHIKLYFLFFFGAFPDLIRDPGSINGIHLFYITFYKVAGDIINTADFKSDLIKPAYASKGLKPFQTDNYRVTGQINFLNPCRRLAYQPGYSKILLTFSTKQFHLNRL